MFTSTVRTIISTKFQNNPLTVTLFSGSGSRRPPPSPVAGEIPKCRGYRVNMYRPQIQSNKA